MARSKASNLKSLKVRILDEEYQVNCSKDEVSALEKSAKYLDEKMRAMQDISSALKTDHLAVMAALNIINDLLKKSEKAEQVAAQNDAISSLTDKLDTTLSRLNSGKARS